MVALRPAQSATGTSRRRSHARAADFGPSTAHRGGSRDQADARPHASGRAASSCRSVAEAAPASSRRAGSGLPQRTSVIVLARGRALRLGPPGQSRSPQWACLATPSSLLCPRSVRLGHDRPRRTRRRLRPAARRYPRSPLRRSRGARPAGRLTTDTASRHRRRFATMTIRAAPTSSSRRCANAFCPTRIFGWLVGSRASETESRDLAEAIHEDPQASWSARVRDCPGDFGDSRPVACPESHRHSGCCGGSKLGADLV
jgi:hypothetical protein